MKTPKEIRGRGRPRNALNLRTVQGRIGQRIRAARERRGLSVEDLAERTGCTSETIYALERGEVPDWIGRMARLLAALDCEIGEIIPEAD